ncbi:Ca(2+)-dependent cysteine protease [Coemansia erecta]|uniref:Ca(2+)-dependent cysteine protease n=1 Tax=Coemansia erecta TaxID=147472 RepID=A0A9W8CVD0_9FUNG|nr:Ca(2+)-dependent cysteine protease [Coemansia erecta]
MFPRDQYNNNYRGSGGPSENQYPPNDNSGYYPPPQGPPPGGYYEQQQYGHQPPPGPPSGYSDGYSNAPNQGGDGYRSHGGGGGGYGGYEGGYNNNDGGYGGYGQNQPPPPPQMPMNNYGGGGGGYGNDGPGYNGGNYDNNYGQPSQMQMPFGSQGFGGSPPPPPPPPSDFPGSRFMGGPPPPSDGGYQMPGGAFGDSNGNYGMPVPGNMPVVRHRPEDIDFGGNNFPTWNNNHTPTPPPMSSQNQPAHGQIPTYNIPQEIQQEASAVTLSNCRGRKRALLIGINYFGTKHMLKGCINDVHNMKKFITEHFGFKEQDMVILTDDQRDNPRRMPTHENIIKAMKWLVSDARMNDSFFFHYSGHGNVVASKTGDEIDGNDETICPVDFESKGQIIDDDMNLVMVRPLPRGARLTAIFDCCHSATALDLPFMYNHMGKLKNEKAITFAGKGLMAAGNLYLKGDLAGALKGLTKSVDMMLTGDGKLEKSRRTKSTMGDVIMFSGCKDDQTSADTKSEDLKFTGAMSHALTSSMNNNPHQTYVQLLQDIRNRLRPKYTQVPQLSTGRLMDMNTIFIM